MFSDDTQERPFDRLAPGTIIDRYIIERPLADGGFSAVYLARQMSDQHQVAIKEYLPRKLSYRNWDGQVVPYNEETSGPFLRGRRFFVEEARMLATLKHPNIVDVTGFFHANSTVYMVMSYDYGRNLRWYLKYQPNHLDGPFLIHLAERMLDALGAIHLHGFLHLDLKPENILIRPGNDPLLLDFGAAQPLTCPTDWRRPSKVRTPGFSPPEQYKQKLPIGPWSDLYALGATLWTCLEGRPPPKVPRRFENDTLKSALRLFRDRAPAGLLHAIDQSLKMDPGQRPQTVAEFRSLMKPRDTP